MRGSSIFCLTLATGFLFGPMSASATTYTFQTLNNAGDPAFNQLLGINNTGTIGGYFGDGNVVPNNGYTLVPPSGYTAENFPNSVQTQVVGINNAGTTVGFYVDAKGNNFGFVKTGSTFTSVNNPLTPVGATSVNQLLGVNSSGLAAGFYVDAAGNSHGYIYNIATQTFTPVTMPTGAASFVATGIDNAGLVSGFYTDGAGNTHGFTANGSSVTTVDAPNGTNTMALGLNNANMLVGSFVDTAGTTQGFLDDLLTNSFQTISDPFASATAAFDVTGTTVNGINDLGDLVGFYSDGTNVDGFLATPAAAATPEPSTLIMLCTGLLGLAAVLHRRRRA